MERDIVFNENDIQADNGSVNISSGVLSEGEMENEKVIQSSTQHAIQKSKDSNDQPEKEPLDDSQDLDTSSTIPFPTVSEETAEADNDNDEDEDLQRYGRGQRP